MTEAEQKVVEILISHPSVPSAEIHTTPLRAITEAVKWDTAEARNFVDNLEVRKLIVVRCEAGTAEKESTAWWEMGPSNPERTESF